MEINHFIECYREQLIKAGVEPLKAEEASKNINQDQLRIISEIWSEWAHVFSQLESNLTNNHEFSNSTELDS